MSKSKAFQKKRERNVRNIARRKAQKAPYSTYAIV